MTHTNSIGRWGLSLLLSTAVTVATAPAALAAPQTTTFTVAEGGRLVPYGTSTAQTALVLAAPDNMVAPKWVYLDQQPDGTPSAQGQYRVPLATRYQNFARDTPKMRYGDCIASYGEDACQRIAGSNLDVCTEAASIMDDLHLVWGTLAESDDAERTLMEVYQLLPGEIRTATRVTTIAQAGATGALCYLSLGAYCIAAALTGGSNIFNAHTNKNMQMANIKLSIVNIVVTRANIRLQQSFIRATGIWIKFAAPACLNGGYGNIIATFPALPAYNNPLPDMVWGKRGRSPN